MPTGQELEGLGDVYGFFTKGAGGYDNANTPAWAFSKGLRKLSVAARPTVKSRTTATSGVTSPALGDAYIEATGETEAGKVAVWVSEPDDTTPTAFTEQWVFLAMPEGPLFFVEDEGLVVRSAGSASWEVFGARLDPAATFSDGARLEWDATAEHFAVVTGTTSAAALLEFVDQTTNWTFGPNEFGRIVRTSNAITGTIPANASVALSVGYQTSLVNTDEASDLTISADVGVTLNGVSGGSCSLPAAQTGERPGATLHKYDTDAWEIVGSTTAVT